MIDILGYAVLRYFPYPMPGDRPEYLLFSGWGRPDGDGQTRSERKEKVVLFSSMEEAEEQAERIQERHPEYRVKAAALQGEYQGDENVE